MQKADENEDDDDKDFLVKLSFSLALGETDELIGPDILVCYLLFFTVFLEHTMLWVRFTDAEGRLDDYIHKMFGFGLVLMAVMIPTGIYIYHGLQILM